MSKETKNSKESAEKESAPKSTTQTGKQVEKIRNLTGQKLVLHLPFTEEIKPTEEGKKPQKKQSQKVVEIAPFETVVMPEIPKTKEVKSVIQIHENKGFIKIIKE